LWQLSHVRFFHLRVIPTRPKGAELALLLAGEMVSAVWLRIPMDADQRSDLMSITVPK